MKKTLSIKPLSINEAWQGRRFKTKKYKDYERNTLILLGKNKMIKGFVSVEYNFFIKNFKMSDVGNFEKPISDIVVKSGLIEDDRFITEIVLKKYPINKDEQEYIIIKINKL